MPKCIKFARISEKSYEWLYKLFAAVAERINENLEPILERSSWDLLVGTSVVSRQKQRVSSATDYNAVDESDGIRRIVMEVEALLEASEQLN